ncbi:MAG: CDP-2,3-bis-(O-geranylgeranyl)-sn-glycerol synthase [Candidatus Diapherotrites archaeon]|nr:CDP-2,3-bis-(O-geranylgeranyl)-sn-glycerol synthase [Candidatus Diapherotrites archaeon]
MNWWDIALFLAPAYVANAGAMLFGMVLKSKTPLDFGIQFIDRQPLLGKGKTWKGTFFGIFAGTIVAFALMVLFPKQAFDFYPNYLLAGFLISAGAIFGDLAGSFVKRRLLIKSGSPTPILDQLDFIVGAYVLLAIFYWPWPSYDDFFFVCIFTIITHISTNYFAFKLGLKKVPW